LSFPATADMAADRARGGERLMSQLPRAVLT